MNIQRKNSAHHFRMQSEREQTLVSVLFRNPLPLLYRWAVSVGWEELKWRQLISLLARNDLSLATQYS